MQLLKTRSFNLAVYQRGDPNSKKLAIVLPGRLDTKDYPHMQSHVNFLADLGFLAISFDPPGTWESPGEINIYTMTNWIKAVNEVIEYFKNIPTVVIGHSRGGTIAMLVGGVNPAVSHIISIMSHPAPSKSSIISKKSSFELSFRDAPSGGKREFLLPLTYFADAKKYDAVPVLSKCFKPKLFIFGEKDIIVSPEEVRKTYEKSAQPKLIIGVDSNHDYRRFPKIINEINLIMSDFLNTA